jgi:hypothetical protein
MKAQSQGRGKRLKLAQIGSNWLKLARVGYRVGTRFEPVGEGEAGLVVEDAAVELVADGKGEPGDLAGPSNCIQIHGSVFA